MSTISVRSTMLILALCWIMIATIVTPVRAKGLLKHQGVPRQGGAETDLMSLLTNKVKESQYLFEAHAIIKEVQAAPNCNQLAAYQLLASCKNLETGPDGTESPMLLERVKTLYAARLAVCELQSAYAAIPTQCTEIMSISLSDLAGEEQPRLHRLWYGRDSVESRVLQPCLKALHEKSTCWTSYSNNRAQAITMCHAIRDHLEREQTVRTHQKLVKAVAKISEQTSEVSELLSQTQQRHNANHLEVQDLFETFVAGVHAKMEVFSHKGVEVIGLLSDLTLSISSVTSDVEIMSEKVKNASSEVDLVKHGVTGILQPVIQASSEISSNLVDVKDLMERAQPFLLKGTEIAHTVSDSWAKVQMMHKLLLDFLPKLGLIVCLTLLARLLGIRKRRILLCILAFMSGVYAISPMISIFSSTASTVLNFISKLPDWARANEDLLALSGLLIIAVTFATITRYWLDSIRHSRVELKYEQERQSLRRVRRHDRHKNLAVDLGSSKRARDLERCRFTRAQTAPPKLIDSEWV